MGGAFARVGVPLEEALLLVGSEISEPGVHLEPVSLSVD